MSNPLQPARLTNTNSPTPNTTSNLSPSAQPSQPPPQAVRPMGSLLRRAQHNTIKWVVPPVGTTLVRFDLNGLGDPLYRLIGGPLNMHYSHISQTTDLLTRDTNIFERIKMILDESWNSYGLSGAILLYPWSEAMRGIFTTTSSAETRATSDEDSNQNTGEGQPNDSLLVIHDTLKCFRAIDMHVIFNVLARARSQVLSVSTPLALELSFLNRAFITDDPRLVHLVQATGYVEEIWQ